jgi:hypothetical protein
MPKQKTIRVSEIMDHTYIEDDVIFGFKAFTYRTELNGEVFAEADSWDKLMRFTLEKLKIRLKQINKVRLENEQW